MLVKDQRKPNPILKSEFIYQTYTVRLATHYHASNCAHAEILKLQIKVVAVVTDTGWLTNHGYEVSLAESENHKDDVVDGLFPCNFPFVDH